MMINHLQHMYKHLYWANQQTLNAMKSCEEVPNQTLVYFSHVLSAEKVWLTRLKGEDSSPIKIWPIINLQDCEKTIQENCEGYFHFLQDISEEELNRDFAYRTSKGVPYRSTVLDVLTHVALHGSYHRGQIMACLRGEGHEPVNTDYIYYKLQEK